MGNTSLYPLQSKQTTANRNTGQQPENTFHGSAVMQLIDTNYKNKEENLHKT